MSTRYAHGAGLALVSLWLGCSLNPQPLPPDAPEDAGAGFGIGADAGTSQTSSGGATTDSGSPTITAPGSGSDAGTHEDADGGGTLQGNSDAGGGSSAPDASAPSDAGLDGPRDGSADVRVGDASMLDAQMGDAPLVDAQMSDVQMADAAL